MEEFRNIADETFPSFLGYSLNSTASVTENVTLSSNPGLPIAASTVARSRTGCDNRPSDVLASYLEEQHSLPPGSSHSSQSDPELTGKFALSFRDDMEVAIQVKEPQLTSISLKESNSINREQDPNVIEHSNHNQDTLLEVLPLERLEETFLSRFFLQVGPSEPSEKPMEGEVSSDHLSNSLSSFLENEKLSSLTSSEEDSTGKYIDDEVFSDNRLEAYFEQLIQPEMAREDTNIQKLSECCTALKLSENGVPQV
ncbi:CE192 protein, partial [Columbina picui]|nr:CE192 protein [Columbina picui]